MAVYLGLRTRAKKQKMLSVSKQKKHAYVADLRAIKELMQRKFLSARLKIFSPQKHAPADKKKRI